MVVGAEEEAQSFEHVGCGVGRGGGRGMGCESVSVLVFDG